MGDVARRIITGFRPPLSSHCPKELKYRVDSMLHIRAENRPKFSELSVEVDYMRSDHAKHQKLRGAFNVLCRTTSAVLGAEVRDGGLRSVHKARARRRLRR